MTTLVRWKASRKLIVMVLTIIALIVTPMISWAATEIGRPILPADDGINTFYYGEGAGFHRGIDFSNVALGDSVLAAANGIVVDLRENLPNGCWPQSTNPLTQCDAYGNYLLIRHAQQHYDKVSGVTGWVYTLYLHLQKDGALVSVNDNVVAGQQIGQGDDTGDSTGNHLHFQLIVHNLADRRLFVNAIDSENRTRNPELWLRPSAGTARLAGKVTDGNGVAVADLTIYGLQKAVGAITLRTYSSTALKSDDILFENFATTDITPGTYCLQAKTGATVYRDFGCNNVFIAGQTTYVGLYPVYLSDVRGHVLGGWNSSLTVRNNSTTRTAQVTTSYFTQGGTLTNQRTDFIAANGNLTFAVPDTLGNGSAIVVGSEDLAVVAVHEIGSGATYATEAYLGVDRPSATVAIPLVQKNNSGSNNPSFWNSYVYVQNTGYAPANVAVEFFPTAGSGNSYIYYENNVAPGTMRRIDVSTKPIGVARPDYPGTLKFVGAVHVSNAQNQPLAVAATQYKASALLMETSSTQPPANTLYAPLIQNNNNGVISGLALRRLNGGGNFSVQYYNSSTGNSCYTEPAAAGNPDPRTIPTAPSAGACPNPGILNAIFQAASPLGANVNQIKGALNAATYAAVSAPALTAIVPKVRNSGGWGDGFTIMNTSNSNATFTVRLYNSNGTLNATPFNNTALGPRQSVAVFGQIPAGFNGSAVVTSSQLIAVQANSRNAGVTGDFMGSYPALHR